MKRNHFKIFALVGLLVLCGQNWYHNGFLAVICALGAMGWAVYPSLLGNLSLWSVKPNESSLGKIGRDETERYFVRISQYKFCTDYVKFV